MTAHPCHLVVQMLKAQVQQQRAENSRWMKQYTRAAARLTVLENRMKGVTTELEEKSKDIVEREAAAADLQGQIAAQDNKMKLMMAELEHKSKGCAERDAAVAELKGNLTTTQQVCVHGKGEEDATEVPP